MRTQVKRDLKILQKSIDFVIIRDYECLFDTNLEIPKDLDLLVSKLNETQKTKINSLGYHCISESDYKVVFTKYFKKEKRFFFLDFHKQTLTGNPISYGLEKQMILNNVKIESIHIPNVEDYLCSLLMREILAEGFKDKYKQKIVELTKKSDKEKVISFLSKYFGNKDSKEILNLVTRNKFDLLSRKRKRFKYKFLAKNLLVYIKTAFILKKSKQKIVSIIGMDGVGKTTIVKSTHDILKQSGIDVCLVYMGRGKKNVLPVKNIAQLTKTKVDETSMFIRKVVYSLGAFVYATDFFIRHFSLKRKSRIIITDRFSSDILLMNNVPKFLRKTIYFMLPKADMYLYIYDDLKVIKLRRPKHNMKDLERQEKEFNWINELLKSQKIKNIDLQKTIEEVCIHALTNNT